MAKKFLYSYNIWDGEPYIKDPLIAYTSNAAPPAVGTTLKLGWPLGFSPAIRCKVLSVETVPGKAENDDEYASSYTTIDIKVTILELQ